MEGREKVAEKFGTSGMERSFFAFSGGRLDFSDGSAPDALEARIAHLYGLLTLLIHIPGQGLNQAFTRLVVDLVASLADEIYHLWPIVKADLGDPEGGNQS